MPRVHLTSDHCELLARSSRAAHPVDEISRNVARRKRDEVTLRIDCDFRKRISSYNLNQLGMRPNDHDDAQSKTLLDHRVHPLDYSFGLGSTGHHDIAALHVCAHISKTVSLEGGAQLGHRDSVAARKVDPAQQDYVSGHSGGRRVLALGRRSSAEGAREHSAAGPQDDESQNPDNDARHSSAPKPKETELERGSGRYHDPQR